MVALSVVETELRSAQLGVEPFIQLKNWILHPYRLVEFVLVGLNCAVVRQHGTVNLYADLRRQVWKRFAFSFVETIVNRLLVLE